MLESVPDRPAAARTRRVSKRKPRRESRPASDASADLDDDERALFRRATAGARPLSGQWPEPERRPVPPRARKAREDEDAVLERSLHPTAAELDEFTGERLEYAKPSVGAKTVRKLRRGRFSVQAELDLHGMTLTEARETLHRFMDEAIEQGWTCVRIVHGKGLGSGSRGPVIKRHVNAWLQRQDIVLAFSSAPPADGGTGAVYVLLQR